MRGQRAFSLDSSDSSEITIGSCDEATPRLIPQQKGVRQNLTHRFDSPSQKQITNSSKSQARIRSQFSSSTQSCFKSLISNEQDEVLPTFRLPSLSPTRPKSRLSGSVSKEAYRNAGLLGQKRVATKRWSRMISSMSGLSSSFSQGTESMGPIIPNIHVISAVDDAFQPKPALSRMSSLKCPSDMMKHLRKSASAINLSKTATFNQMNDMIRTPTGTPTTPLRLDVDSETFQSRRAVLGQNIEPVSVSNAPTDTAINLRFGTRHNSLRPDLTVINDKGISDSSIEEKFQSFRRRSSIGLLPDRVELPNLYSYNHPMTRPTASRLPERLTSEAKIKLKQKKTNLFNIRLARRKQIVLDMQVKQVEELAGLIQPCRLLSDAEILEKSPRRLGRVFNDLRVQRGEWKSEYMSERMMPLHISGDVNEWGKEWPTALEECGYIQIRKQKYIRNTTALKLAIGSMFDCIAYDHNHEQRITIEGSCREAMHTASAFTLATVSMVQCGKFEDVSES